MIPVSRARTHADMMSHGTHDHQADHDLIHPSKAYDRDSSEPEYAVGPDPTPFRTDPRTNQFRHRPPIGPRLRLRYDVGDADGLEEIDDDLYHDLTGMFTGEAGWANRQEDTRQSSFEGAYKRGERQDHTALGPRYHPDDQEDHEAPAQPVPVSTQPGSPGTSAPSQATGHGQPYQGQGTESCSGHEDPGTPEPAPQSQPVGRPSQETPKDSHPPCCAETPTGRTPPGLPPPPWQKASSPQPRRRVRGGKKVYKRTARAIRIHMEARAKGATDPAYRVPLEDVQDCTYPRTPQCRERRPDGPQQGGGSGPRP